MSEKKRNKKTSVKPFHEKAAETVENVLVGDVGARTVRVTLHKKVNNKIVKVDDLEIVVEANLGDFDDRGAITDDSLRQAIEAMQETQALSAERQIPVVAFATAPLRCAKNAEACKKELERHLGLSIKVLTPEDEGYNTALGVLKSNPKIAKDLIAIVIDLGGRSCELAPIAKGKIARSDIKSLICGTHEISAAQDSKGGDVAFVTEQLSKLSQGFFEERDIVISGGMAGIKQYLKRQKIDVKGGFTKNTLLTHMNAMDSDHTAEEDPNSARRVQMKAFLSALCDKLNGNQKIRFLPGGGREAAAHQYFEGKIPGEICPSPPETVKKKRVELEPACKA